MRYFRINIFWLIVPLVLIVLLLTPSLVFAEQQPQVFSTWEGFEADKCASIWLITKFIDKDAIIRFYPKGEAITQGIPFDTPDAGFRRYYNISTFESLLRHYKIKDPKVNYIGRIIHDIEVNVWEKKVLKETRIVQDEVNKIIWNTTGNKEIIKKSAIFFDLLYEKVLKRNEKKNAD